MGIYASWLFLSADDHEPSCTKWTQTLTSGPTRVDGAGTTWHIDGTAACTCQAGPLVYRGSHLLPASSDPRGGHLDIAAIPNHCHPDAVDDTGPPVEYLRVSVTEDPATYGTPVPGSAQVVLDRTQVEQLLRVLGQWLETPERW